MAPRLQYFFSTGSRYSFLSMSQVPALERRFGVSFDWIPVNGKRIRQLRGVDPFAGPPQSGQYDWGYRERDAQAWASHYGIEFREPQDVTFDVEAWLCGVIAAARQGDVRAYAWDLAQEVFARGTWPLGVETTLEVACRHNLDLVQFEADVLAPQTASQLEQNCRDAVAAGAFGTPTLLVGEDLYWGNDRLVLVDHRLRQAQAARAQLEALEVLGIDHVVLNSSAPEQLVEFYSTMLGLRLERSVGDFLWQFRLGDQLLDIFRAERTGTNVDHICLRVRPFDMQAMCAALEAADIPYEPAQRIYGAQGFGPSVYIKDPQGNRIELKGAITA